MKYPKAPIQEAVFDIKVDKVKNIDINSYLELTNNVLSDYPEAEQQ